MINLLEITAEKAVDIAKKHINTRISWFARLPMLGSVAIFPVLDHHRAENFFRDSTDSRYGPVAPSSST
jgi:hypothetical protein